MNLKIALILEHWNLSRGGAERSAYELACALTGLDMHVNLIAAKIQLKDTTSLPFQTTELSVPNSRSLSFAAFRRAVSDHLKSHHYDIVHSFVPLSFAHVYQPRAGCIKHNARRHADSFHNPFVSTFKRATAPLNRHRQNRLHAERNLCAAQDTPVIAALSDYVRRQFINIYNLNESRLVLIPNGIDEKPFRDETNRAQGKKLRTSFDPDQNLSLFLFAAENFRLKGLHTLIHAARLTSVTKNNFRILIVSSRSDPSCRKLIHKFNLTKQFLFLGSTDQMPALIHGTDAVVLPTFHDASSRFVLEALAAGKPALTTRSNGAAEFLTHNKHGYIIENPADPHTLADALLKLTDKNKLKEMSAAIETEKLYEQVSIRRHARQLLELYHNILNR